MPTLLGACGLICSDCKAYVATMANDAAAIARVAQEWSQEYGGDIQPEYVWCEGCMTAGERKCGHCAECDIRACAVEQGLPNCGACPGFAAEPVCEKIAGFMEMVPQVRETLRAARA
jgi:hypothetical protein